MTEKILELTKDLNPQVSEAQLILKSINKTLETQYKTGKGQIAFKGTTVNFTADFLAVAAEKVRQKWNNISVCYNKVKQKPPNLKIYVQ